MNARVPLFLSLVALVGCAPSQPRTTATPPADSDTDADSDTSYGTS